MKLVINDDNGRITEAPALAGMFHLLDLDRESDAATWLECLSQVAEPFVLFLHCDAATALDRLQVFTDQAAWPNLLKGVVIFNSSRFAGLTQSERVRHEMAVRGLSTAPIHVVRTAIHDNRSEAIIERVGRLAEALCAGKAFASSTWHLEPPEGLDAAVVLWALGVLVKSDGRMASGDLVRTYVLNNIDTEPLQELASSLQATLTLDLAESLRNLMEAVTRRHSDWAGELPCGECSIRQRIRHGFQKPSIPPERAAQDINEILHLYEQAATSRARRATQIALTLPIRDATTLVPFLQDGLETLYAKGCQFAGDGAMHRALAIRKAALDLNSGLDQIVPALVAALRCDLYDLATRGPGNQLAGFDPWLPTVDCVSGSAM